MQALVKFDRQSVVCDFIYPNSEPPMSVPGPQGTKHTQQTPYSHSNAKLVLEVITPLPNSFEIKTTTTTYSATLTRQQGNEVWCSVTAQHQGE